MGVEFRHWVLPTPRTFRPSPSQVLLLVSRLRADRWMPAADPFVRASGRRTGPYAPDPDPAWGRRLDAPEVDLCWSIDPFAGSGLRYPFRVLPDDPDTASYELHLYLSDDYADGAAGAAVPRLAAACGCGAPLEVDRGGYTRLLRTCPRCGRMFDPLGRTVEAADPWTGVRRPLPGGLCHRFAFLVDCGGRWPEYTWALALQEPMADAIEQVLGVELVQVGDTE